MLCCFALFVCLTLLASFFLPSHLSFKNTYIHVRTCIYSVYVHCMYGSAFDIEAILSMYQILIHVQCIYIVILNTLRLSMNVYYCMCVWLQIDDKEELPEGGKSSFQ